MWGDLDRWGQWLAQGHVSHEQDVIGETPAGDTGGLVAAVEVRTG